MTITHTHTPCDNDNDDNDDDDDKDKKFWQIKTRKKKSCTICNFHNMRQFLDQNLPQCLQ